MISIRGTLPGVPLPKKTLNIAGLFVHVPHELWCLSSNTCLQVHVEMTLVQREGTPKTGGLEDIARNARPWREAYVTVYGTWESEQEEEGKKEKRWCGEEEEVVPGEEVELRG